MAGKMSLKDDKDALSPPGNQTRDDFLGHILRRAIKKFFKLQARKLLDHLLFPADSLRVLRLE